MQHARITGLNKSIPPPNGKGESNSRHKLKENDILNIRQLSNNYTHAEIAKKYNVATSTISGIISRHKWKHI